MGKHYKRDGRHSMRSSIASRITTLGGERVTGSRRLHAVYAEEGAFFYQFCHPSRRSRVMICDSLGELSWLEQRVGPDDPVRIRACISLDLF